MEVYRREKVVELNEGFPSKPCLIAGWYLFFAITTQLVRIGMIGAVKHRDLIIKTGIQESRQEEHPLDTSEF